MSRKSHGNLLGWICRHPDCSWPRHICFHVS